MQKEYRTKCRSYIVEYLQRNKEKRFRASDVFSDMTANNRQVNLATIYRNLDKMTEQGILQKYKTANSEACLYQYIEPQSECHNHLHMQCEKCGMIIHLECDFMDEISHHIAKEHNFFLECKGSVLTGLCGNCKTL